MALAISIFKSYDIRGIYPDQLNESAAFEVGRGFVEHTKAKSVVVGHDARLSSPQLFRSLVEGIISQGANVYNIGMMPTECVYFAVGNYDFNAGIMVTASHNPREYNGFKMIIKDKDRIEMVRGKDLLLTIEKGSYQEVRKGKIYEKNIWPDYISFVSKFLGKGIKKFRVAVDASNGVMGTGLNKMEGKLPIEIVKLNFKPDGNFPNHSPNPLEKGSSGQISAKIQDKKADFGIMFDADADRIFLVDEKGQLVPADITLLLLAKYLLEKNPGSVIAHDPICSKSVDEFIKKWGGLPIKTAVGFVNVREGLIKNNGIMGGEVSGHYCFKDYFYMDSGMIAFLSLLQIISNMDKPISETVKELNPYFKSNVINFAIDNIDNKEEVLERVKEKYSDGKQDFLDGVTVEYKDWWFNLRPSNTEPLIKLTIEADNGDMLELKKQELSEFISSFEN